MDIFKDQSPTEGIGFTLTSLSTAMLVNMRIGPIREMGAVLQYKYGSSPLRFDDRRSWSLEKFIPPLG